MAVRGIREVTSRGLGLEGASQQHARLHPVALHGAHCDAEGLSRLLFGKTTEEPAIDYARQPRLESGEAFEGFVQIEQQLDLFVDIEGFFIEGYVKRRATALERGTFAGAVDEDVAHRQGSEGEEMRRIQALRGRIVDQLEVRLIDETRCGQRSTRNATGQPAVRDGAQLLVGPGNGQVERFRRRMSCFGRISRYTG
jgi:hypothetical protein